jgi:exosortase J
MFKIIVRFGPSKSLTPPALPLAPLEPAGTPAPRSFYLRFAAFALVLAIGSISYARALIHPSRGQQLADNDPKALGRFPQRVGAFTLERTWNEYLVTGPLIFYWADYVAPGTSPETATRVSVGVSGVLGAHDTLLCHAARGEDWLWHDNLILPTRAGSTSFSASFFNGGATQYLEATTVCTGLSCGQFSSNRKHFGLSYSRPDTTTLLTQSPSRPIPVLLRTETTDTAMAPDAARSELTTTLAEFLRGADLAEFTAPYRQP